LVCCAKKNLATLFLRPNAKKFASLHALFRVLLELLVLKERKDRQDFKEWKVFQDLKATRGMVDPKEQEE
jgi:hypothetical protein